MKKILYGALFFSALLSIGCSSRGNYKILNEDKIEKIKYSVNIEIPREINESEIESIFSIIKNKNPSYKRYFVDFYLPGMTVGSGAWAIANYDNKLDIKIMGLATDSVIETQSRSFNDSIGIWKDNSTGLVISLIENDEKYLFRFEFNDGSYFEKAVSKKNKELKFIVSNSPTGDFYIILDNCLEAWDNDGKIKRYEIVKNPNLKQLD